MARMLAHGIFGHAQVQHSTQSFATFDGPKLGAFVPPGLEASSTKCRLEQHATEPLAFSAGAE